ncbi:diacylglycerol/lipid kinase family protein [Arenibacterium halophilum]|uniref:Diacylglycerol kinase n=1 Tax=Arenibacterium halophilum TaxID=2583821 RepID=A0ABY2WX76_9RHOB|nr:diacylglycerol kinase family protein [Arenibacterium halophilum]TMV07440.1 diacylglycerol kinase [Arenibacterium halophilum]
MENRDSSGAAPSIVVILNLDSGKDETKPSADEILSMFRDRGRTARVAAVSSGADIAGEVEKAINQTGVDCVVAAGGDGTICGVAGALANSGVDMGVLPLGTFNYFARRFEIPEDIQGAIDTICSGGTETIDLGCVNGEVFINNASMGLYPAILKVREDIYQRWGRSRLAAYWSVAVAMATVYRPMTMRIEVDGVPQKTRTPTVFVAMSAYQLDEFEIEGSDAVRAGKFAIYLAPDCGRLSLIWKAAKIAFRGLKKETDFTLLTGAQATVATRKRRQLVAMDGERSRLEGPFVFSIMKNALAVRVLTAADRTDTAA